MHHKDKCKEKDLKDSVLVNSELFHPVCVGSGWIDTRLLEKAQESLPELDFGQGREAHEKEDTIKDRHGDQLRCAQHKHGQTNKEVTEEKG